MVGAASLPAMVTARRPSPPPLTRYRSSRVQGDLRVWRGLPLTGLRRRADVTVWLPPGYAAGAAAGRRYPVAYLNDGQNVFDPVTAFVGTTWQADRAGLALHEQGLDVVLVAIPSARTVRGAEYTPYANPHLGGGRADAYLRTVTDVVKPLVDAAVATSPGPQDTVIVGSSLGGVVSLHAWLSRPDVFGGAGVFSPAFWWSPQNLTALDEGLRRPEIVAGARRVYLDVGGREVPGSPTVQAAYVRDTERAFSALREAGVPVRYVYDAVAAHSEPAWAERLPAALAWLLRGYDPSLATPQPR